HLAGLEVIKGWMEAPGAGELFLLLGRQSFLGRQVLDLDVFLHAIGHGDLLSFGLRHDGACDAWSVQRSPTHSGDSKTQGIPARAEGSRAGPTTEGVRRPMPAKGCWCASNPSPASDGSYSRFPPGLLNSPGQGVHPGRLAIRG